MQICNADHGDAVEILDSDGEGPLQEVVSCSRIMPYKGPYSRWGDTQPHAFINILFLMGFSVFNNERT